MGRHKIGDEAMRRGSIRCAVMVLATVLLAQALAGCESLRAGVWSLPGRPVQRTLIPGDAPTFSVGYSQDREYFKEYVVNAQYAYHLHRSSRTWVDIYLDVGAFIGWDIWPAPISVRWELKDGRKFIVDDIPTSRYAAEFRDRMWVPLQHHRERRPPAMWDADPMLAVEVWEDMAILKWHVPLNLTPPSERTPYTPNKKLKPHKFTFEEYVIAEVKGHPVTTIDFRQTWEPRPGVEARK